MSPEHDYAVGRLSAEYDNIRAALARADAAGEDDLGLRLARVMTYFSLVRGHYREGHQWLARALGRADRTPTPARAKALVGAGWLARLQGDSDAAAAVLSEAVDVARAVGNQQDTALALHTMGMVDLVRGDYATGARRIEEALALFLELESTQVEGPWLVCLADIFLGQIALAQGNIAEASALLEEARTRQRTLGFSWGLSFLLRCLGDLALVCGNLEEALDLYRESVSRAQEPGEWRFLAEAVAGVASVAVRQGRPQRAARLFAAASAIREQIGAPMGWGHPMYERGEAAVRAVLSPGA